MREDNIIAPEQAPIFEPLTTKPKFKIPPIALGIILGVLASGCVLAIYTSLLRSSPQDSSPITLLPTKTTTPPDNFISDIPDPTATSTPPPISGSGLNLGTINWLKYPQIEKALSIFKTDENTQECLANKNFYSVANFSNGAKLINLIYTEKCGMGESTIIDRLIKTSDNQIYYLVNSGIYSDVDSRLENVKPVEISIPGIISPEKIITKSGVITGTSFFLNDKISFTQIKSPKLVDDTEFGSVYVTYEPNTIDSTGDKFGMQTRYFYLRLKDDTVKTYAGDFSFFADDQIPRITWNDGSSNTDQFTAAPQYKCGGSRNDIIKEGSKFMNNLKAVGKTTNGLEVFQFTDSTNLLFKELYNQYSSMGYRPTGTPVLSEAEFLAKHTHILWKDSFNDWHVFVNQNYSAAVECGKPVIYLYPSQNTQVTVRVAADVTKSEPTYPQKGWTVMAHPNGQLEYQGKTYPNLFWEGLGHGNYPNMGNSGFIVTQEKLISTIKSHLSKLGLNSQESADFMEFWADKLPKTPYVRLTWITTSGMNQLAPLSVSPQPDTVIRIFLDFEGLEEAINLVPQKLSSVPRSGFTLIEWGGLLQGKLK